jgi:hypothetical protein
VTRSDDGAKPPSASGAPWGDGEDRFFEAAPAGGEPVPPPRRRASALFARNPVFAVLALLLCGWLLWDLWPEVSFFFSSTAPIDLGGPRAYRLDAARENRLAQVRGDLAQAIPVSEARTGAARTVGRIAGTNLVIDRPGRGGPPVFEGRLLPARRNPDYAAAVGAMRERGAPLGDGWLVLRDGERPRLKWLPVAASAILALLALVNLRALVKRLAD